MANTGFLQASTDLDYILIPISSASLVPNKYRKYNNPYFGYSGTLWSWGYGSPGQLGLGNTTSRSSPNQVGSLVPWRLVSAGYYMSAGIKTNGTLWTWGDSTLGQLGDNDPFSNPRSSPVQVGTGTDWNYLSTRGYLRNFGIKSDGTLWSWGYNNYGQLGLNDRTIRSSPTQVAGSWSSIYTSQYVTFGITTAGTLFAWGYGIGGWLGLNDFTNRSSPVQVGSGTNWKQMGAGREGGMVATKTDGTLWSWGANGFGQLGLGDRTSYYSPVQVGTNTNWSSVGTGHYHTLGIKTDGTLWAWGRNNYGQLGQSNTTNYSSPVQIGSGTNWSKIFECSDNCVAIKTDGTLWTWGRNSQGQLGLGNTTIQYSPVQVGTGTTWYTAAIGESSGAPHVLAITFP